MAAGEGGSANAAASTSLRETAKWLVGGIAATAAGIFAGSSLTRLGSLDFVDHPARLSLAIIGIVLGFGGLAYILKRALAVLTVESLSFKALINSTDPQHQTICADLVKQQTKLPGNAIDLKDLLAKANAAMEKIDPASKSLVRSFTVFHDRFMPAAGFRNVKAKFDKLVRALWVGSAFAIIGFGLFAWAANPPEEKPAPAKPPLLVINPN